MIHIPNYFFSFLFSFFHFNIFLLKQLVSNLLHLKHLIHSHATLVDLEEKSLRNHTNNSNYTRNKNNNKNTAKQTSKTSMDINSDFRIETWFFYLFYFYLICLYFRSAWWTAWWPRWTQSWWSRGRQWRGRWETGVAPPTLFWTRSQRSGETDGELMGVMWIFYSLFVSVLWVCLSVCVGLPLCMSV